MEMTIEERIAKLEQRESEQDKRIAALEVEAQKQREAMEKLADTARRWL